MTKIFRGLITWYRSRGFSTWCNKDQNYAHRGQIADFLKRHPHKNCLTFSMEGTARHFEPHLEANSGESHDAPPAAVQECPLGPKQDHIL
jgi:hypothetical protein